MEKGNVGVYINVWNVNREIEKNEILVKFNLYAKMN